MGFILMKEKEIERLKLLKEYEDKIYKTGVEYIAGSDEAGRGPLAGPVVVRNMYYAKRIIYRRNK